MLVRVTIPMPDSCNAVRRPTLGTAWHSLPALAAITVNLMVLSGCDSGTVTADIPSQASSTSRPSAPAETVPFNPSVGSETSIAHVTETAAEASPGPPPSLPPVPAHLLSADSDRQRHALLVGCTKYDHLGAESHLRGPVHDVVLMRNLLIERFRFPADQIAILSEASGPDQRPIRKNIEQELTRIADVAAPGHSVVVLLSGHGCQQPDVQSLNASDIEPDGLDEVFLPADVKPSTNPAVAAIPNAINDDDLGTWISRIREKGAFVWVIIDACHSGSAVRGAQVRRQLPPEMLLAPEVIRQARAAASQTRGVQQHDSGITVEDKLPGGIVALYAAQPNEPTIEMPLPINGDEAQWTGLLTYTVVQILSSSNGQMTYRDLAQRVHAEYLENLGRLGPTPLIEGTEQSRQVLDQATGPDQTHFVIERKAGDRYVLNAGRLHGLTKGAVLAVAPPAGKGDSQQTLGHVQVVKARAAESEATPVEYENSTLNTELPLAGSCRVVSIDFGDLALSVAVEGPEDDAALKAVRESLSQSADSPIRIASDPAQADWLIRKQDGGQIVLVPGAGWSATDEVAQPMFGPAPADDKSVTWIRESLGRIARVNGLLKVCGFSRSQKTRGWLDSLLGGKKCNVATELVRIDLDTGAEVPVDWKSDGLKLHDGDRLNLRITNKGTEAVDFSVLFIDSHFGITPLYPSPGVVTDNRLDVDGTFDVGPMNVDATSTGVEHLVVIATRAEGQPLDWTWLSQPSIPAIRGSGPADAAVESSLGKLFQQAVFAQGATRGMKMADSEDVQLKVISWTTTRDPR